MSWFDFFDDIFGGGTSSGGSGEGSGSGAGSFAQYGMAEVAARVPYVGQVVGFYLAGHEDLSDLTNFPSGGEDERGNPDRAYRREFGIDDIGEPSLLRNPDLLADNTAPRVSVESWMTAPTTPSWAGQEIVLDLGGPSRPPAPPAPVGPIDEVIVRGVRPDRSGSRAPPQPGPPLHMPYRAPPDVRPEHQATPRHEAAPPAVQTTREIVIVAEPAPFDREESDPEALAAAEGRGRIELGDLRAFARGGFNGLISAGQLLARLGLVGMAGSAPVPVLSLLGDDGVGEADKYKLPIDPRYGGAGLVGEQLMENLAFEGLPLLPRLGKLVARAARSEHLLMPAFWFLSADGMGGASRAARAMRLARERAAATRVLSMAERAAGVPSVANPSQSYVVLGDTPARTEQAWGVYQTGVTGSQTESVIGIVDKNGKLAGTRLLDTSLQGLTGKIPEAKYGNMGQLYNPERYEHFVGQSQFLIDFAQSTGRPGVEYRVSSQLGTTRVLTVFTYLHPEYLRSGFLTVGWYPLF
jgi:hypothetical protein